ncbi:MAG: hypothetical protein Q9193_005452 [Seirophora villosa]
MADPLPLASSFMAALDLVNRFPIRGSRYHLQRTRRRHRCASHQHYSDDSDDNRIILTDPSVVESDVIEPLSEDSFTFDDSASDSGKAQVYVVTDEPLDPLQSMDVDEKNPPKPSPYTSLGHNVSRSRHLRAQHPNLSSFTDHISMLTDTTTSESENAAALLHQVRHRDEHSIPTKEGKYLESGLTTWYPSLTGFAREDASQIHFLCMPYFSLSPYIGDKYVTTADAHPLRSLLQTQYPSASMERDMLQAVCQLQGSSQRQCYHVPQIWCLWVEDSMETYVDALRFAANAYRTSGYIFKFFPRRDSTRYHKVQRDRINSRPA